MEKEFIPYEQALALKELGFDKILCSGFYFGTEDLINITTNTQHKTKNKCLAPLYQQVFKWFRDIHGLYINIYPEFYTNGINFNWQILWYLPKEEWTDYEVNDGTMHYGDNGEYPTCEEAELACLIKLIEIVKKPK